jgi:hypothetical protein
MMIGKRSSNHSLFDVGYVYPVAMKPKSFFYQLAVIAKELFSDDDFADLYCRTNGRPSVPPSQLALMLLLQFHDGVSDEEAVEHSVYDARWCAVLGKDLCEPMCAKSTLQLFRSQLIVLGGYHLMFLRSIERAKDAGLLVGDALKAALDTKPIIGRGAVEDTYNLLATAMRQLARALAREARAPIADYLAENNLPILAAPSVKGAVSVDWSDEEQTNQFLGELVGYSRQLLALAAGGNGHVRQEAQLLEQLILQDVEQKPGDGGSSARVKQGTPRDRIPSATDPEQRHGRKSSSKRFNGHKASVIADVSSGVIVGYDVIAGNDADDTGALTQVEQAEADVGIPIGEVIGDCAYGSGETRQEFADAFRTLIAKVPKESSHTGFYPKSAFVIDLIVGTVTCPGGNTTSDYAAQANGAKTYQFGQFCNSCPLREQCTQAKNGRTISVHPQEELLQAARQYQNSEEGRVKLRERIIIENVLARLAQYGISQARYIGTAKTKFQLAMTATVANLRRVGNYQLAKAV